MTTPCKLCQQGIPASQIGAHVYHVQGLRTAIAHYTICTERKPVPGRPPRDRR